MAQDFELLSAYLDGALPLAEQTQLETRLAQEPALQLSLDELRQTVALIGALPLLKAPRNYTLTLEQAQAIKPNGVNAPLKMRPRLAWRAFLPIAAALVVIFGGVLLLTNPQENQNDIDRSVQSLAMETMPAAPTLGEIASLPTLESLPESTLESLPAQTLPLGSPPAPSPLVSPPEAEAAEETLALEETVDIFSESLPPAGSDLAAQSMMPPIAPGAAEMQGFGGADEDEANLTYTAPAEADPFMDMGATGLAERSIEPEPSPSKMVEGNIEADAEMEIEMEVAEAPTDADDAPQTPDRAESARLAQLQLERVARWLDFIQRWLWR